MSDWLFCDCDWPDGPTTFLEFGKTLTWIMWRGQVNVKSLVFLSGQANKNSSEIILMTWTERCNCWVVYRCMHELCVGTLVIIYNNFYSCWEVWLSNYHFQIWVLQIIFLHTHFTGFIQFKYIPKLRHKFSCFPRIDSFGKYLHVAWLRVFQRKKKQIHPRLPQMGSLRLLSEIVKKVNIVFSSQDLQVLFSQDL